MALVVMVVALMVMVVTVVLAGHLWSATVCTPKTTLCTPECTAAQLTLDTPLVVGLWW